MSPGTIIKQLLRRFGIELKHLHYGLDLWLDLRTLFTNRPPSVILDVGANLGQTSLKLADMFPGARIWAFEPNPSTLEKLRAAVLNQPAITPVGLALGATKTTAQLQITGSSVNASLLPYEKPSGNDTVTGEARVEVITLDDFAEKNDIETIDLLKVDAQGYDLEVLRGAEGLLRAGRIRALVVEVNFVQMYSGQAWFHEIYEFVHRHGLRLCGLHDVRHEKEFHLQWGDALFVLPQWAGQRPRGTSPW
jgi:FkbM family methyltransferase